jgi:hypothetical protein
MAMKDRSAASAKGKLRKWFIRRPVQTQSFPKQKKCENANYGPDNSYRSFWLQIRVNLTSKKLTQIRVHTLGVSDANSWN